MCGGKFLKKDENERCEIYEDLTEKILQWQSANEESRIANPISSKRGLYSIKDTIVFGAKPTLEKVYFMKSM